MSGTIIMTGMKGVKLPIQHVRFDKTIQDNAYFDSLGRSFVSICSYLENQFPSGSTGPYMRWVPYVGPPQSFLQGDTTRDGDWTMVANKNTSDRPSPQPTGVEEDLLPPWSPTQSSARASYTVYNEWTLSSPGWISQYGTDVLTQNVGAQHVIKLSINGVVKDTYTGIPSTYGMFWQNITPIVVVSGAIIRVTVIVTIVGNNLMYWDQQAALFASPPTYCSLAVGSKDGAAASSTAYSCHALFTPGTSSPDWNVVAYGGAAAGGNITQVNADWNATSGLAYILNKPPITYTSPTTTISSGLAVVGGVTCTNFSSSGTASFTTVNAVSGNNINVTSRITIGWGGDLLIYNTAVSSYLQITWQASQPILYSTSGWVLCTSYLGAWAPNYSNAIYMYGVNGGDPRLESQSGNINSYSNFNWHSGHVPTCWDSTDAWFMQFSWSGTAPGIRTNQGSFVHFMPGGTGVNQFIQVQVPSCGNISLGMQGTNGYILVSTNAFLFSGCTVNIQSTLDVTGGGGFTMHAWGTGTANSYLQINHNGQQGRGNPWIYSSTGTLEMYPSINFDIWGASINIHSADGSRSAAINAQNSGDTYISPNAGRLYVQAQILFFSALGRNGTNGAWGGNYYQWDYNGSALQGFADNTAVNAVCDVRVKHNIRPIEWGLDAVMKLKPISFNFRTIPDDIFLDDGRRHLGFLGHELEEVCPWLVDKFPKDGLTIDGRIQPQGIEILSVVALLTKAVQELTERVALLEGEKV